MQRIIEQLEPLVGIEHPLDKLNYALKFAVRSVQPAAIGAHHITCSDETERECTESFQRCFAQDMVPRLKFGNQSAFRSANLGGGMNGTASTLLRTISPSPQAPGHSK